MEYPALPSNAKAINIIGTEYFSSLYDIVWSFDYAISGNANTEAGFTVFLTSSSTSLSGGGAGIDLAYSGLSASTAGYTVKPGISGAVIAAGFDTTGLFAASAADSGKFVRDGLQDINVKRNSVTLRGGWPSYSYNTYSYHQPISSLTSEAFNIIENGITYKTIRARLGDLGRTLYIDFRNTPEEDFKPLIAREVFSLPNLSSGKVLLPGISFASPISSNNTNSTGNIFVKNVHFEGLYPATTAVNIETIPTESLFVPNFIDTANILFPVIDVVAPPPIIVPPIVTPPTAPVETITAPPVVSLQASKTNIASGESVTLFWSTVDAEFLELKISGAASIFPTLVAGVRAQNGQLTVTPTNTTTYTLVTTNRIGTTVREIQLSVTVSAATRYINTIRSKNATVTSIQEQAITSFFNTGTTQGWLTQIKRLYLPIWGNADANAVDMITTSSGVWRGEGGEFAAGFTRQSGTLYFDFDDTIVTDIGLTSTSQSIFKLTYFNGYQPPYGTIGRIIGNKDTFSIGATYYLRGAGQARGILNIGSASGVQGMQGIHVSSLLGGTNLLYAISNTSVGYISPDYVIDQTGSFNNPLTDTSPTAFYVDGQLHPNLSLGAYGVGLSMTKAQINNFIPALRTLWEKCTGLKVS